LQEKADALNAAEGSNPEYAMASLQDTIGVLGSGRQGLNIAGESPSYQLLYSDM